MLKWRWWIVLNLLSMEQSSSLENRVTMDENVKQLDCSPYGENNLHQGKAFPLLSNSFPPLKQTPTFPLYGTDSLSHPPLSNWHMSVLLFPILLLPLLYLHSLHILVGPFFVAQCSPRSGMIQQPHVPTLAPPYFPSMIIFVIAGLSWNVTWDQNFHLPWNTWPYHLWCLFDNLFQTPSCV